MLRSHCGICNSFLLVLTSSFRQELPSPPPLFVLAAFCCVKNGTVPQHVQGGYRGTRPVIANLATSTNSADSHRHPRNSRRAPLCAAHCESCETLPGTHASVASTQLEVSVRACCCALLIHPSTVGHIFSGHLREPVRYVYLLDYVDSPSTVGNIFTGHLRVPVRYLGTGSALFVLNICHFEMANWTLLLGQLGVFVGHERTAVIGMRQRIVVYGSISVVLGVGGEPIDSKPLHAFVGVFFQRGTCAARVHAWCACKQPRRSSADVARAVDSTAGPGHAARAGRTGFAWFLGFSARINRWDYWERARGRG